MNNSIKKLGLAMSVAALLSFVVYTLCFAAILFVNAPFSWSGIVALAEYEAGSVTLFKYIGMACMIVYACAFFVMVLCTEPYLDGARKISGKIASFFALAFCITISINYFVQLSSTRLQLQSGAAEGLSQFTQSFSISAINGINMLGWTVFYALSSLALAFIFDKTKLGRAAKWACILNSVCMLAGLAGYMLNSFALLLFTMNLGLGAFGLWIVICILLYFKRK